MDAPHTEDTTRGYRAGLAGRRELDTTRWPWASTANALVRASHFNQGVREAQRVMAAGECEFCDSLTPNPDCLGCMSEDDLRRLVTEGAP